MQVPALKSYHLLPSVRGDFLQKLGRVDEARTEFRRAAEMTGNARERELLLKTGRGPGMSSVHIRLAHPDDRLNLIELQRRASLASETARCCKSCSSSPS